MSRSDHRLLTAEHEDKAGPAPAMAHAARLSFRWRDERPTDSVDAKS